MITIEFITPPELSVNIIKAPEFSVDFSLSGENNI